MYKLLRTQGHNIVAMFTVPDVGGRPDPLAEVAEGDGVPVLKFKQWRKKGEIIPEVERREREREKEANDIVYSRRFLSSQHTCTFLILYVPCVRQVVLYGG